MNPTMYQQLLKDVQDDVKEIERLLSDLRGIRSYVQGKLKSASAGSGGQYREMMEEVQKDISEAKRQLAKLQAVASYGNRKLKGEDFVRPESDDDFERMDIPSPPSDGKAPAPRATETVSPAAAASGPAPRSAPRPTDREPTAARKPHDPEERSGGASQSGEFGPEGNKENMQTIVFGSDGFPVP